MSLTAERLIPAKFLGITGQILICIIIAITRQDNILTSVADDITEDDTEYKSADTQILSALSLTMLCVAFEGAILLFGVSLFYDRINAVQIFLHILGIIFYSWYVLDMWSYEHIWTLWIFFALVPAGLEIGLLVSVCTLYKSKFS